MKRLLVIILPVFLHFTSGHSAEWTPAKYLWCANFALLSDTPPPGIGDIIYYPHTYKNIKSGDVVWVQSTQLIKFYSEILPHIRHPFVLVTNFADDSFPTELGIHFDIDRLIENPLVIHIFAQNNALGDTHPKVSSIPIGLDFHTVVMRPSYFLETAKTISEQEEELEDLINNLPPTTGRIPRAFIDFQHFDSIRYGCLSRYKELGEDRHSIFQTVKKSGVVDYYETKIPRGELLRTKGHYAFSISPHGNGLDCIRTWEDLVLGCIVIVKTSPLDCLYEGLPVVIVDDWEEITEENMQIWLERYGDASTNPAYRERLTQKHWQDKIRSVAAPYKH